MNEQQYTSLINWARQHIDIKHFAYLGDLRARNGQDESVVDFDLDQSRFEVGVNRLIWLVAYRRAKGLPIDDLELPDLSGFFGGDPVDEINEPPALPVADPRDAEIEILRARVAELETPPPEPEPETHFADLMLADETTDDAKARLSQRLRELRHYLIAPEIRVNEDGSLGLTSAEQAELQDLERRQTLGRWLEA